MKKIIAIGLVLTSYSASARGEDLFSSKVEPLLKQHCYECHSHEKKIKGGLALDSRSGWEKGGDTGPAVVPGKPEDSLLIRAVSYVEKDLKMPPKRMLAADEIALLTDWVRRGAPDPRTSAASPASELAVDDSWEAEFQKRLDWWSLKPMRRGEPPVVQDAAWSRDPVDRFIKAALDSAKLAPAPRAEPAVIARRLSFVLTGLPPTESHKPHEALVDRLLASPHFGEHFARHWMDVVRYTDTYGYEWDNPAKGSHEYRDYLIRAFNNDVPFDQLVREQLAGDLLPHPRVRDGVNESLIGPMFYHMGEHRHGSSLMFNGIHQEMVNNKIDAFSKAFLATTVACARCHDHKLEAVSQRDYYALAAMFTTPRWTSRVIDAPGRNDAAIERLSKLRASIRNELAVLWKGRTFTPEAVKAALGDATKLKPQTHEVAYPLVRFAQGTAWGDARAEWQETREQRRRTNAAFKSLADGALPSGWVTEGDGMKRGFVEDATPLISIEGDAVVARLLPRGWHTHALSSKLPGALRMPPEHTVPGKFVSLDLAGGEFSGALVVDDHAFQNETVSFLTGAEPQWKTFADAELKNGVQQVTVEFCTASLNPNFPPRTGLAKGLKNSDYGYDKRSWLSITGIVSYDTAGTPQDELDAFASLYDGGGGEPWTRVCAWFAGAVQRWCDGKVALGDRAVLDWLLAKKLLPNTAPAGSKLAALLAEYRRVEAGIPFPRTVNSMDERGVAPANYPLNVRGNVDSPGTLVQPGSLKMLHGERVADRLALAESLVHPEHPLTARVYVNRVWQWLFGTGLVATPDDFGRLGAKPSNPELLDWLAREFIRDGWSTKKLVRRIVLSEAFRQSGAVSDAAREADADNRLMHHYPTRRVEAEAVRDALLAVSGRLDARLYGRPIDPPRAAEDDKKRLFSGPLDGGGRRSLYLRMSIMEPPKFLTTFNLPDLKLPTGRRDVSNVPTQALLLLNDPFTSAMAKHWAAQLVRMPHASEQERIAAMFERAYGRGPTAEEMQRWAAAVREFATAPETSLMRDEAAWAQVAHAIFNTKEFIYYR